MIRRKYTIWLVDNELSSIHESKIANFGTTIIVPIILDSGHVYKKEFYITNIDSTQYRVVAEFDRYTGKHGKHIWAHGKLHKKLRRIEKEYRKEKNSG